MKGEPTTDFCMLLWKPTARLLVVQAMSVRPGHFRLGLMRWMEWLCGRDEKMPVQTFIETDGAARKCGFAFSLS